MYSDDHLVSALACFWTCRQGRVLKEDIADCLKREAVAGDLLSLRIIGISENTADKLKWSKTTFRLAAELIGTAIACPFSKSKNSDQMVSSSKTSTGRTAHTQIAKCPVTGATVSDLPNGFQGKIPAGQCPFAAQAMVQATDTQAGIHADDSNGLSEAQPVSANGLAAQGQCPFGFGKMPASGGQAGDTGAPVCPMGFGSTPKLKSPVTALTCSRCISYTVPRKDVFIAEILLICSGAALVILMANTLALVQTDILKG